MKKTVLTSTRYIFLVVTCVLSATSVSARCWYEGPSWARIKVCNYEGPKGTPIEDIDKAAKDAERRPRETVHLGRQGCLTKANSVIENNVNRRTNRGLTELEKRYLAPWFQEKIDLNRVTMTWDTNLNSEMRVGGAVLWVASAAQTFGYQLFFRERHDPGNALQMISLAHELVHTVQANRLGSLGKFCEEYMNGWSQGFDYFKNPMEREAFDVEFRFAQWLANQVPIRNSYYTYQHGLPNNYRTVQVPARLP